MPYVRSLTDVLAGYLDWHLSRLKLMARFTSSVLTLTTTNLWKISLALKAAPKQESNYRRIQRFLSGYEVDFTALGILLLHLLPQRPPYEVVIDRTEWHFGETGVNILMVGIAHEGMAFQGMAFPVAWTALPSGGSSNFRVAIRLRSDRRIGRAPEGPSLPARMHARTVDLGSERALEGTRYLSGAQKDGAEEVLVPVRVVTRRIGDEDSDDPFLILATSGIDPAEATEFYKRRWNIEPLFAALNLFAALKSRGFDLEETKVTDPEKVENLVGLLALAFGWARLVGEERAAREGPPTTKSHGRKERSMFRYGLDRLQNILSTLEPQDQAFFRCLSVLRSPSAAVAGRSVATP